jgi:dihydrolipoamide dehydrogenase
LSSGGTYAQPQVASVGITEQGGREAQSEVKIGRFPFRVNGKAIASGDTDGFVKVIFDAKTGALIGAHMIGAGATERKTFTASSIRTRRCRRRCMRRRLMPMGA